MSLTEPVKIDVKLKKDGHEAEFSFTAYSFEELENITHAIREAVEQVSTSNVKTESGDSMSS